MRRVATSKPAKLLATLAALVVIAPGVVYALPQVAGADDAFVVLSGSMVPFFDPGDVIFVDEVDPASLEVGDVVTFRARPGSSTLITHRVIEVIDAGGTVRYRTQGDANEDPDPFIVTQEMVVGKYDFQLPKWGLLVKAIRSKAGYFLLVLLPASLVIGREFVKLYKELDAMDRAKKAKKEQERLAREGRAAGPPEAPP